MEKWLSKFKSYSALPIRLAVGLHLIIGTQDNVFSWERMLEFESFLQAQGMPFPLFSAVLSAYAQFICGILFIVGWKVRWAAIVMTLNFITAIALVHIGDSYQDTFPAIMMLAGSIFLALNGSGSASLDQSLSRKSEIQSKPSP